MMKRLLPCHCRIRRQEQQPENVAKECTLPPKWKAWIAASRPHTLVASVSPCIVGLAWTLATLDDDIIDHTTTTTTTTTILRTWCWSLFVIWFLFCILIQLGTNLHNDYADFVRGADTSERVGQARATQKGWLTPWETALGATYTLILATFVAIWGWMPHYNNNNNDDDFINNFGTIVIVPWFVMITSILNAVAYTGGPYPLGYIGLGNLSIAYSGLGDVFCFVYFGLVATLAIPYLALIKQQQESSSWNVWHVLFYGHHNQNYKSYNNNNNNQIIGLSSSSSPLCSPFLYAVLVGLWATAIIVVNNLRDRHTDVVAGKRTLAVRLGGTFCRCQYTIMLILSYTLVVLDAIMVALARHHDDSSWTMAGLPLLTMPLAWDGVVNIWRLEGKSLNPFVGYTARVQLLFCILLACGILYR